MYCACLILSLQMSSMWAVVYFLTFPKLMDGQHVNNIGHIFNQRVKYKQRSLLEEIIVITGEIICIALWRGKIPLKGAESRRK